MEEPTISISTVPFRMRFLRLKDVGSGKAWHPFCRFFSDGGMPILVGLCFLSHQLFNQHVFSKCQVLFGLDINFGSTNHSSFWNMPRHQ